MDTSKLEALDARERVFVTSYLAHFNASRAARTAGYSTESSRRAGHELIRRPDIRGIIEDEMATRLAKAAEALRKVEASETFVLTQWVDIINADVNEIVQMRRGCCRFCHGVDGKYQRTPSEMRRARATFKQSVDALVQEFDEEGGTGFDPRREPNPGCMECFGEGVESVHVADTRDLTPAARSLLAGIKSGKDGIEVKLHSKEKALELLARHLGMLKDKLEVEGNIGLAERLAAGRARTGTGG